MTISNNKKKRVTSSSAAVTGAESSCRVPPRKKGKSNDVEMEPRETERERAQREEEEEERVRQEEEEEKEAVRLEEMAKALRARRMQRQRGRVEASSVEQNPAGNLDQDNVVVEERAVMEGAGVHTDSGGTEGSNGSKTVRNANNVNGNVHHEASDREDDDIVGGDDFDEGEGEESNAQGKVLGV